MDAEKYFVIFCENSGEYWNSAEKKLGHLIEATEYYGSGREEIETIIMTDPDLLEKRGHYFSVKTIIKIDW